MSEEATIQRFINALLWKAELKNTETEKCKSGTEQHSLQSFIKRVPYVFSLFLLNT